VEQIADHIAILDDGRTIVSGALDDLKMRYQRLHIVFKDVPPGIKWPDGAQSVRQEGRVISILASGNVERILEQVRAVPGSSVERHPVTLKELFLEHTRRN
jgi:ABC-2 type transport system ATP-binding protein